MPLGMELANRNGENTDANTFATLWLNDLHIIVTASFLHGRANKKKTRLTALET